MTNQENLPFVPEPDRLGTSSGAKRGHDEMGQLWVDLTGVSEIVDRLEKPTRVVEYRIGFTMYRVCRGADDPTPDNVAQIGGIYFNFDTGHMGRELKDVLDEV